MRGTVRGIAKYSCGAAYGAHGYDVIPSKYGETFESPDFRSYLFGLISQASKPRQAEEAKQPSEFEIYPGVRVGESMDVAILLAGCGIVLTVCLGGCFLLGWVVDANAKAARLQYAAEYAQQHRQVAQQAYVDPAYAAANQYSAPTHFGAPRQHAAYTVATQPQYVTHYVPQQPQQYYGPQPQYVQHQPAQPYAQHVAHPQTHGTAGGARMYTSSAHGQAHPINGSLRNDQVLPHWH
jgi:hypothetical protein